MKIKVLPGEMELFFLVDKIFDVVSQGENGTVEIDCDGVLMNLQPLEYIPVK